MDQAQITDINEQILKLRALLPLWGIEANDLVEFSRNAERAAANVDERIVRRVRGLLETSAGWHDTLVYWEEQDGETALRADIRVLRASLDATRAEIHAAAAHFKLDQPMAHSSEYHWHEFGRQAGQAAVAGSVADLSLADTIASSWDWLDGVIDGAEGSGKQIRLIRISDAHREHMERVSERTSGQTYRQYSIAHDEHFGPGNGIQVDFD
jgi:hypothetical protein